MLTRLAAAAYTDPVAEWKRQALASVGASDPGARGFGVRLRVSLGFVLAVMVAGAPFGVIGWAATLVGFLSVFLVQELPSVLSARARGRNASVVLALGGSETLISGPRFGSFKLLALAALGSLGNVMVAMALWQLVRWGGAGNAAPLVTMAGHVHLLWGLGQALPLTPFRLGRAIGRRLRPPLRFAHAAASFVGLSVVGLWVLRTHGLPAHFSVFVLALMVCASAFREAFNDLRDEQAGVALLAAAAAARLREDRPAQAVELAKRALSSSTTERNQEPLWKTLAWAAIGKGDPFTAHAALSSLAADSRDLHLVAAYLACCGRTDEAIALLAEARHLGQRARETTKLLVDLLFQSGQRAEARGLVEADRALLAANDLSALEAAFGGTSAEM